jgi:hypothetical protein
MNISPIHTKEPKPEYNIPFVPAFAVEVRLAYRANAMTRCRVRFAFTSIP